MWQRTGLELEHRLQIDAMNAVVHVHPWHTWCPRKNNLLWIQRTVKPGIQYMGGRCSGNSTDSMSPAIRLETEWFAARDAHEWPTYAAPIRSSTTRLETEWFAARGCYHKWITTRPTGPGQITQFKRRPDHHVNTPMHGFCFLVIVLPSAYIIILLNISITLTCAFYGCGGGVKLQPSAPPSAESTSRSLFLTEWLAFSVDEKGSEDEWATQHTCWIGGWWKEWLLCSLRHPCKLALQTEY